MILILQWTPKFLDLVDYGDVVLSDKGFPSIRSSVEGTNAFLAMPPFLLQFLQEEVKNTYCVASGSHPCRKSYTMDNGIQHFKSEGTCISYAKHVRSFSHLLCVSEPPTTNN